MTEIEFTHKFGVNPEKCKEIMEDVAQLVNAEVEEVIKHLDYYMCPMDYCDKEYLIEQYGEDAFEKDEDDDGYPNLYNFKRQNSAESIFQRIMSRHTFFGGYTSAIEACELMKLEGWKE